MEELTLITPSVLFSAVSLILLAYTNRFLAYAQLVRTLKESVVLANKPVQQSNEMAKISFFICV